MSETVLDPTSVPTAVPTAASAPVATENALVPVDPTDQPVPLWPEGVIALAAGAVLLAVAFKHRTYLMRNGKEAQRLVEEFQRQGGVEELTAVAKQAATFFKGG